MNKWDKRFMELAKHVSGWSKDPSTKVGCVIADSKNRIVSIGYNGFPTNVNDSPELYENRDMKLQRTIHAEANAIMFAKQDLEGCSIYVWPLPSCANCTATIIQAGIKRVIAPKPTKEQEERWKDSFDVSDQMFKEAEVQVRLIKKEKLGC